MDATKTLTLQAVDNDWLLDFDKKGYKMESDVIPSYLLHVVDFRRYMNRRGGMLNTTFSRLLNS
jgi:hypothetical protein